MKSTTSKRIIFALLTALAIPVGLVAQTPTNKNRVQRLYRVVDLGTLGGTFSFGNGINNKGWVDGTAALRGNIAQHAVVWQKRRKTDLGTLGGPNSFANYPLNERGQIAGAAETSVPDPLGEDFCGFGTQLTCLPFLWENGVMTALPTLGGSNGAAFEINNRGQVAGYAENSEQDSTCPATEFQAKPVVWEESKVQQLPTFPGDPDGLAIGINDSGQTVGFSGNCVAIFPADQVHALLWQDGAVTDLGNLGGTMPNNAQDINNQGQVVGFSSLPGNTTFDAFLWQKGAMSDLGTLPGDSFSLAFNINNRGQVVGQGSRAVLWQRGVATDLNTLVPGPPFSPLYLLVANGINDRGEIVGVGLSITGEQHAFLAIPCDETHPDAKGCKDDAAVAAAVAPNQPALAESPGTATRANPSLGGSLDRLHDWLRARQSPGYHVSGPGSRPIK